jgi:hypothetical protein
VSSTHRFPRLPLPLRVVGPDTGRSVGSTRVGFSVEEHHLNQAGSAVMSLVWPPNPPHGVGITHPPGIRFVLEVRLGGVSHRRRTFPPRQRLCWWVVVCARPTARARAT